MNLGKGNHDLYGSIYFELQHNRNTGVRIAGRLGIYEGDQGA